MSNAKTVIVTGASQGIGADVVRAFMERGYNIVANSLHITRAGIFQNGAQLQLVDGDIGQLDTARRITGTALDRFGGIDALVNNAGIFVAKAFTDYTPEDFRHLVSTNLEGFIYTTQLAVLEMLKQKRGGSIVTTTASLADHPMAGHNASVSMITKGGLNSVTRSLAMEYAKDGIRVNAVAPGTVRTPLSANTPEDAMRAQSPLGKVTEPKEIAHAILFLTESQTITGEVLLVNGGAHLGRW
jgi:NAD(P)-dependent dehydrogenase (short-subunit alcohol dehydrogenase family)